MPPSQAEECEAALRANPDDLELRCKMLGYFMSNRLIDPIGLRKFHEHVLFTIRTFPDNKIAGSHYAQFDLAIDDRASYDEAKSLWLSQIAEHAHNEAVMANAANFFAVADKKLSDELKLKLQKLV